MSKDLYTLIRASGNSGASGQSFKNHVTGAASGVSMTDYRVTGFTSVSGQPNAPGVTTYASPTTFDVYLTLVRGAKAYLIENLITSAHFAAQDSSLWANGRTYSQTVTCNYAANTNNTIIIHVAATVTGTINTSPTNGDTIHGVSPILTTYDGTTYYGRYNGDTAGTAYDLYNSTGAPDSVAKGHYASGDTFALNFRGTVKPSSTGGTTDSVVGLQWLLDTIDNGVFNPAIYTPTPPNQFRQSNVDDSAAPYTFYWYSSSSFSSGSLLATTGASTDFSPGLTNPNSVYPSSGAYYLRATKDAGTTWLYFGSAASPTPISWSDPRTDI